MRSLISTIIGLLGLVQYAYACTAFLLTDPVINPTADTMQKPQSNSVLLNRPCVFSEFTPYEQRKINPVVGYNFDWNVSPGIVVVNSRNVFKQALVVDKRDVPHTWTSLYGSVSFNQMGLEFPFTGMNEKGLTASLVLLNETDYSLAHANLPALTAPQWIQFQLDTASTVFEAIENAKKVRLIKGVGKVHFFVTDRIGNNAIIEFLEGELKVFVGSTALVPVLSNQPYEESVRSLNSYLPFGGTQVVGTDSHPQTRFVRAAMWLQFYLQAFENRHVQSDLPMTFAFQLLENLRQPSLTQWTIAYQPSLGKIAFASRPGFNQREVLMELLDFRCGKKNLVSSLTSPQIRFRHYQKKEIKALLEQCDYLNANEFFDKNFRQKIMEYPVQYTRCNQE